MMKMGFPVEQIVTPCQLVLIYDDHLKVKVWQNKLCIVWSPQRKAPQKLLWGEYLKQIA
jgi:hypothetical protein